MPTMPANGQEKDDGSATKWSGQYESSYTEVGSTSGMSANFEEKESGTMMLSTDPSRGEGILLCT